MTLLRQIALSALLPAVTGLAAGQRETRPAGELAWALHSDPATLDPARVEDAGSEQVRYLTAGVLVRFNRHTLQPEPALADRWLLAPGGHTLTLHLRPGLRFSDGSPLTSADAAASLRRVLLPETAAPAAGEFLAPSAVRVSTPDPLTVRLELPRPVPNLLHVLDEIAVEPGGRPTLSRITSGPFFVAEWRPGESLRLGRNPYFWGRDREGRALPYAAGIRLEVLGNREAELLRFARGQYDLVDALPPGQAAALERLRPGSVRDLGASLSTEQLWFNQSPAAPLPDYERAWFTSTAFRVAVSMALHRADLARVAFEGHATVARGFVSPANAVWTSRSLHTPPEDVPGAQHLLLQAGFRLSGQTLVDPAGHPVRFSLLTNTGNVARARMAALIQQDLAVLGMEVTLVTLDFPALVERLRHNSNYEACLLGHPVGDPDPSSSLNEWLSSSPDHGWNPSEKTPATPWEAELDRLFLLAASTADPRVRHESMDRAQQIVADQQPYIYLVHPDPLVAISPALTGVEPAVLAPSLVWNVEYLRRAQETR